jgi:hypothetical protein
LVVEPIIGNTRFSKVLMDGGSRLNILYAHTLRLMGIDLDQLQPNTTPFHGVTVNTKNWYRKETDLWAEFGNKIPFSRKNLLRGFGKDACDRQYVFIRQKDCLR